MKDRGKSVVAVSSSSKGNFFSDNFYPTDFPCRKHPSSSSSVGICAYCLKDRLIKLVCSDCGEQRLSSCSCSDISSSYPNSCTVEVGSVGRISFLIDKDYKQAEKQHSSTKPTSIFLKRSSSTSTHVKRGGGGGGGGFWRFGRFFRKRRDKDYGSSVGGVDEKCDIIDNMGMFRSRSIGSFDACNDDVHVDAESERETEKRRCSNFIEFDDDSAGFIDIKFGFSSESKPHEFSCIRTSSGDLLESEESSCCRDGVTQEEKDMGNSRISSVDYKQVKKCRKSFKVWKWILKHQSSSTRVSLKKDDTNC